jgi:hypothetical protein
MADRWRFSVRVFRKLPDLEFTRGHKALKRNHFLSAEGLRKAPAFGADILPNLEQFSISRNLFGGFAPAAI